MSIGNAPATKRKIGGLKLLFLDDEGNPSSMRVMAAIALIAAGILAVVEVLGSIESETEKANDTELVLYFLAAAFMPKVLQKFAEGSGGSANETDTDENRKGWFTDNNGNPSSVRLMSLGALLMAIVLATIEVNGWGSSEGKNELVLYFLAAAFVPKSIQKFAESKP